MLAAELLLFHQLPKQLLTNADVVGGQESRVDLLETMQVRALGDQEQLPITTESGVRGKTAAVAVLYHLLQLCHVDGSAAAWRWPSSIVRRRVVLKCR